MKNAVVNLKEGDIVYYKHLPFSFVKFTNDRNAISSKKMKLGNDNKYMVCELLDDSKINQKYKQQNFDIFIRQQIFRIKDIKC